MTKPSSPISKYLLVAAMPTPNGALHLGHVGAQYLPLDVFRRYREQQGHRVVYFGGFDVFDNAVCVAAQRNGRTPQEHAAIVTSQIESELAYLDVRIDRLINYADEAYSSLASKLVRELQESFGSRLSRHRTTFPFDASGHPVGGNWLRGQCVHCSSAVKGYSCDACGRSLLPAELKEPITLDGSVVHWNPVDVQMVTVPVGKVVPYIEALSSALPYLPMLRRRLTGNDLQLQWTNIDTWGLSVDDGAVFYNRNFTLVEQLLMGDLARSGLDLRSNAFSPDSGAITILAYGKDNAGLLLTDIPALALATSRYTPYRYQWISQFYNLDGRKMSTSGNHAIWVRDVMARGVSAEAVRLYVCRNFDLERDIDLSLAELDKVQAGYGELLALMRSAFASCDPRPKPSADLEGHLHRLRWILQEAMRDDKADISAFPRVIDEWVTVPQRAQYAHQWLRGLSELAAPVLPRLADEIDIRLEGRL